MPSDTATKVAEQILDDLDGAAYYADPEILAGILKAHLTTPANAERLAKELLIDLLRRYAQSALRQANKRVEVAYVAGVLERHGLR